LAVGLSITLVFQAMLNMAVNVHLVPVTGLTLPLVSMGGSSIWFNSVAIDIISNVSRYVDEMEGERQASPKAKAVPKPEPGESKIFVEAPKPEKTGNRLKSNENTLQPTV
jgi:cell division protein FtsW